MPSKNTTFNLRHLYLNLQATHDSVSSRVVVSLDATKAFDIVEWEYLWECLCRYRLGPNFIAWIKLLYQSPVARIQVNGRISDPFLLSRGTRQRCPLSPMLYALVVEPLALAIREHLNIRGLRSGHLVETISLYAEDMLLYLEDVGPS